MYDAQRTGTLELTGIEDGLSPEEYVRRLIERDLAQGHAEAGRTFAEILAPARAVGESPEEDEELAEFVESEMRAYRARKRQSRRDV